ncbi:MAG: sensor histidine kinase, partial [Epulopiscium sp.]|nr:sensor histidine kinase [Candidatus Epulonipiscium sp.]
LRYNIEEVSTVVDINLELEQVRAYVEIEKARFGDKLKIHYQVDDDINIKIPSLVIQPLVENSIKHGILKGNGSGNVWITVKKHIDDKVQISVEDDGLGIPEEVVRNLYSGRSKGNKIGLSNVHNRLKHIYGKGLEIENLCQGTKISFVIYDKNIEEAV